MSKYKVAVGPDGPAAGGGAVNAAIILSPNSSSWFPFFDFFEEEVEPVSDRSMDELRSLFAEFFPLLGFVISILSSSSSSIIIGGSSLPDSSLSTTLSPTP
jgi:hypothetical protein